MSTAEIADKVDDVYRALDRLGDVVDASLPGRREHLAAAALTGLAARPTEYHPEAAARMAVAYADALIAELDKVTP